MNLENHNKKCSDCIHNNVCSIKYTNVCPYAQIDILVHNCTEYLCKNDIVKKPPQEWFKKLGDVVYYIYQSEVINVILMDFEITDEGFYIVLSSEDKIFPYREPIAEYDTDPTDWCIDTTSIPLDCINHSVFLTQDEANKALIEWDDVLY